MVGFSSLLLLLWVAIGCVSMGQAENSSACPTACVPDLHTADPANTSFHQFAFSGSVVDIFFVISGLKNYDFVDEGHFWVSLEAIRLLAARTSAGGAAEGWDTRIHILADNAKVLSSTMQLGPPFYAHDMATMRNLSQPFFEIYQRVHDSVNTLEYEFLCFNRWHLMQHIVSTSPFAMRRLLSLDLDVLLLVNASQLVDRVLHALRYRSEEDFDVVVLGLGAITLFSADGLRAFSGYMSRYFARPVEEVAKAIKRYMHFFSDMMMMKEFLLDASASSVQRKNACFELWRASDYYTHWKPQPNNACLLEMLQCVPMNGYREMLTHDNQLSLRSGPDRQVLLQGSRETLPYCLIHFQGRQVKSHLHILGFFIRNMLSPAADNDALDTSKVILAQVKSSREIITLQGTQRRPIASYDAMLRLNLSHLPIVHNVPPKLLDLFTLGQPLT